MADSLKVTTMTTTNTTNQSTKHQSFQAALGYGIKNFFGVAFYGVLLFLPAGTLAWPHAWVYLGLFMIVLIASSLYTDPQLLRDERGMGKSGRKNWDLALVSTYGILTTIGVPILAGLDWRNGWSSTVPLWLIVLAGVLYSLGWGFGLWAMAVNRFFSKVVRIQHERGHHVIDEGPYRILRHPGYVGGIIHNLGTPLILGSWWALIPAVLAGLLMVLRTDLEDRTLQAELEGYKAYTERVRYRLIPGIW
jgi:protein-S-isoprenylcysteine O-methyltransferase Ste14